MAKSVIQGWVSEIPLRQQGVLILALRGPDGIRKESPAKAIIRSLRACTMNSGRKGVPMESGEKFDGDSFMRMDLICDEQLWDFAIGDFYSDIDEYNIHFLQHLLHAAAVLGFNYPNTEIRQRWLNFYQKGVRKLHMLPETREQFLWRLRDGIRLEEDE